MNPDSTLSATRQWRLLRVRGESPVVQFFADYSPESWYWSRCLPSKDEGSIQTSFISKSGFSTQINLALVETRAKYAVFHRRTITYSVFEQIVGQFPGLTPIFVVGGPTDASRNPTMPLTEWVDMVRAAVMERCVLVCEKREQADSFVKFGVPDVRYLPPMVSLPDKFKREGKSPCEEYRILLSAEAFPVHDLLNVLLAIRNWSESDQYPSDKHLRLILSLGEGPDSTQENYRDGLIGAAKLLFGERFVEVWPRELRIPFLARICRDVDAVVDPSPRTTIAIEANLLKIPTYAYVGGKIVSADEWGADEGMEFEGRKAARLRFWKGLV